MQSRRDRDMFSGYGTKQSDCKPSVMFELWKMQSTPSLLSFPGPPWPEW